MIVLEKYLHDPFTLKISLGLAILLLLPSIGIGFFADDYFLLAMIEGRTELETNVFDMYRFLPDNDSDRNYLKNIGFFPWWIHSELRINFFRPFSSILLLTDYNLFGRNALGYHLHSILWLLMLVYALYLLYKITLPEKTGMLALLLYVISPAHLMASAWISNRNSLVATVPALFGLCAHIRFRENGWKAGLPLSLLGYSLGLLAGETAIGVMIYLGSYELLAGPGNFFKRMMALSPALSLGAVYIYLYKKLGYGSFGSGFYNDPATEPLSYLKEAVFRLPALIGDAFLKLPSDFWIVSPKIHPILALGGVFAFFLVAISLFNSWKELTSKTKRNLSWLILGSFLSCLPLIATIPMSRLLIVPFIGGSPVIATILLNFIQHRKDPTKTTKWKSRFIISTGYLFFICHLFISPLQQIMTSGMLNFHSRSWYNPTLNIIFDKEFNEEKELPNTHLIMPISPDQTIFMYLIFSRSYAGKTLPRSFHSFSFAPYDHELYRRDAKTLELTVKKEALLLSEFEKLYRTPNDPIPENFQTETGIYKVRVLEQNKKGPTKIEFTFKAPLEDPSYIFLRWKDRKLMQISPPKIGETLFIPKVPGPSGL